LRNSYGRGTSMKNPKDDVWANFRDRGLHSGG
jgi:hypothetical protein